LGKNHLIDRAADLRDFSGNIAENFCERRRRRILVDEDVRSPGLHAKFGESDSGLVEIGDTLEFGTSD
jgi:MinD-like ATPase involved in chromosome partitioning or flagellar assembly